ncbi:MAG: 3-oxoacyl-[acyl-carrier-protein] reductase [Candidatus Omnitrophica bacterium]|nr:3-oxoacyl-[acyl-carrier-protein] reductase [Candidatus Omnitrophota bacterium]
MMLKDQVAVITGGARGIGKEIALRFAGEGARVVLYDLNPAQLEPTVAELRALGSQAEGLPVNVTDPAQVDDAVQKTLDKCGHIDILINNAGITKDGLLLRMDVAAWDAVINVNLRGTFLCTKAVSRLMLKQKRGRIVNIASIIGLIGNAGQANYAASKAGIIGLTKSVARELASRAITCNAIAPGFIQTDMTAMLPDEVKQAMLKQIPLGEFGTPADVADAALFLVSAASRYITGQVLVVDGGMVM